MGPRTHAGAPGCWLQSTPIPAPAVIGGVNKQMGDLALSVSPSLCDPFKCINIEKKSNILRKGNEDVVDN